MVMNEYEATVKTTKILELKKLIITMQHLGASTTSVQIED